MSFGCCIDGCSFSGDRSRFSRVFAGICPGYGGREGRGGTGISFRDLFVVRQSTKTGGNKRACLGKWVCHCGRREENNAKREINYRQALTARVRGLVYVDGIAQVQGIIAGALYVRIAIIFLKAGIIPDCCTMLFC